MVVIFNPNLIKNPVHAEEEKCTIRNGHYT